MGGRVEGGWAGGGTGLRRRGSRTARMRAAAQLGSASERRRGREAQWPGGWGGRAQRLRGRVI